MKVSDIASRKFSRAFQGYNISEVDLFLDDIAEEMTRMEQKLQQKTQEMKLLELRNDMLIERLASNGISLTADINE